MKKKDNTGEIGYLSKSIAWWVMNEFVSVSQAETAEIL